MPDVKRAKNISLGDILGKCKRHAFLVGLLNPCLSFYISSVNGYVAAVGLKLEHMRACLSSSKVPQTIEWLINSRCLFLVLLGSRRSKIKVLAESESGKGSLPAHR